MIGWVDIETTGLDPFQDDILEVAVKLTDDNLNEIKSCMMVIELTPRGRGRIDSDPVVKEMHTESGLLDLTEGAFFTVERADRTIRDWLMSLSDGDGEPIAAFTVPMAGSTIGFDRAFLKRHMPMTEDWFHYRSIDVSMIKELSARWAPTVFLSRPDNGKAHRAMADIDASIAEARHYRTHLFDLPIGETDD